MDFGQSIQVQLLNECAAYHTVYTLLIQHIKRQNTIRRILGIDPTSGCMYRARNVICYISICGQTELLIICTINQPELPSRKIPWDKIFGQPVWIQNLSWDHNKNIGEKDPQNIYL